MEGKTTWPKRWAGYDRFCFEPRYDIRQMRHNPRMIRSETQRLEVLS